MSNLRKVYLESLDIQIIIDNELHENLNRLARMFYKILNYEVEEGFDFSKSKHPMEIAMYSMAVAAYEFSEMQDQFN